jgi:hypothetical protein
MRRSDFADDGNANKLHLAMLIATPAIFAGAIARRPVRELKIGFWQNGST